MPEMNQNSIEKTVKTWQIVAAVIAATVLWFFLFSPSVKILDFWVMLPLAAGLLSVWAVICGGLPVTWEQFQLKAVGIGAIAALMLYVIFFVGNFSANLLFGFASDQVNSIYAMKSSDSSMLWIALMLLFVSSPGEEIFWRGFLQKWAIGKWGSVAGWLVTALLYAAVHIVSGNFILVMAALGAGLFWGLMAAWLKDNLLPVIISHSLWTFGIFVLWPIR